MLAMLIGLPFLAFLITASVLWIVMFASALKRLFARRHVVPPTASSKDPHIFHGSRHEAFAAHLSPRVNSTSQSSLPDCALLYGRRADDHLDTTFKIFRGSTIVYAAGCDVAVPKQTRARRRQQGLIRATLLAAALCCIPALTICAPLLQATGFYFPARAGSDHAAALRRC